MASKATGTETADKPRRRGAASHLANQIQGQSGKLAALGLAKVADLANGQKDGVVDKLDAVVEVARGFATSAEQQFGDFAGGAVNRGVDRIESLAADLREKSIDDIVDGTRSVIARHPAVAIGAASVIGLVVGRIAKAGLKQAAGAAGSQRTGETERVA